MPQLEGHVRHLSDGAMPCHSCFDMCECKDTLLSVVCFTCAREALVPRAVSGVWCHSTWTSTLGDVEAEGTRRKLETSEARGL